MSQYTTITQYDKDGNAYTVDQVNYPDQGPSVGLRWYTCVICGLEYREDQVMLKGGAAFCIPLGDYKDMDEIR